LYSKSVEEYVNGILNYKFTLDKFDKIKAPFFEVNSNNNVKKKVFRVSKKLENRVKIELISVFEGTAYIKVDEYLGDAIIDEYKKWVKKGDKFAGKCKVLKVGFADILVECKGKKIYKTLNKKLSIRDK
jgi:hypothetical protein